MGLDKLGRYDIIRTLGKGAMGMVYEARDPNLDRRVAIKTIKVEHLSQEASAEYEARFRTEARSAARLQHPNIVSVYDSDRHGDMAYLVMEYVQGDDLKKILDSGVTHTLEQTASLMRDLLSALEYAHRQNIVHRDVKPANLLVEASGRAKLTDFGVARIQDSGEATRTRGSMVGTLKYMAPEQVQGLPVDARADIFAAGVVLYQLLTGRRPFDGGSDFAIIQQIVGAAPALPSSINAQLPGAVDAVVARALAKSRDERFASAHGFMLALQEAVGQAPDPTILPPLGLRRGGDGAGTGSGSQRSYGRSGVGTHASMSETSSSTVTQELELVYWKDVKDSDDPADLQGFLDRFANGIYADLARRRLRRLAQPGQSEPTALGMQTRVLDATDSHSGFSRTEPMGEETLVVADSSRVGTRVTRRDSGAAPHTGEAPGTAGAAVAATMVDRAGGLAATVAAADASEVPETDAALASPARGSFESAAADAEAPGGQSVPSAVAGMTVTSQRRNGRVWAIGAALVLAAGLAFWSFGPAPGTDTPSAALVPQSTDPAAPASDSSGVAAMASPAVDAASGAAAAPAAAPAVAAVASSAAAGIAKSRPAAPRQADMAPAAPAPASPGTAASVRAAATAAVAAPVPSKPAASRGSEPLLQAGAAAAVAGSPEKGCEGRVLLGFQSCMTEQCAKPEFVAHPVCKQRRMAEQARAAQQNNRN